MTTLFWNGGAGTVSTEDRLFLLADWYFVCKT
jgi:hypothetical protein